MWKAEAENICGYDGTVLVAVKTTKEKAPDKEKSDLLQEMQIMQKIGHHPNVVTLLGVTIDKGSFFQIIFDNFLGLHICTSFQSHIY